MDRRQALKLLGALGTTGLAAGCGVTEEEEEPTGEPIKIGLIAPRTGGNKEIGTEITNGFKLFLKLNNDQLGGRKVTLLSADEGETAQSGKAAVDGLLKERVLALTGVVSPAVMLAARESVEQARIPLIGSNASPRSLQSVVYIWRTSYVLNEPGEALGQYLAHHLPAKARVAIIAPDNNDSQDVVQGFRQKFGNSDPRVQDETIWTQDTVTPGKETYAPAITQLLRRKPAAIFCHFAGASAARFLKQLHAAGYRKEVYGPGFLTEGSVLNELSTAEAKGIMTALNYSADLNNAANRRFASAYRELHNASPTTYAMASYDAAQVLDKAIRLAGPTANPQQVNLALGKVGQIDSPRGPWQFNQSRTPQQKWYLRKVQPDGRMLSNLLINELATLG